MFRNAAVVILADLACACIATGAAFALCIGAVWASMALSNDPGGPMFLPIVVMAAALAAGAVSGVLFAVTLVVDGLRRLARARWWTTSLVAVPAVSAVSAAICWLSGAPPPTMLGVAVRVFVAFGVYWHAYVGTEYVLSRVADTLFPNHASSDAV